MQSLFLLDNDGWYYNMASTINADVTNGLVLTPDTSGEINLQAGGVTKMSVTSSGVDGTNLTNIPAANLTGSLPAIDGSNLTGLSSTNVLNAQIVFYSSSQINGGSSYVTPYSDFRYASGMRVQGTHTKQSATSDIVLMVTYNCRNTSGNFHAMGVWCDAGNNANLFHVNYFDPYYWQQNRPSFTTTTRFTGLAAGNHTYSCAAGRGDASNSSGYVNGNPNSASTPSVNGNSYTMLYVMEVE